MSATTQSLSDEIDIACRHLPDGWDITIFIEKGAGWIQLMDEDGEIVELDLDDMTLAQQVEKAVGVALERVGLAMPSSAKRTKT